MLAAILAAAPVQAGEVAVNLPTLQRLDRHVIEDNCSPLERTSWKGPGQVASLAYLNLAPRCVQGEKLPVDVNELAREEVNNPLYGPLGPMRHYTSKRGWSFDYMRFDAKSDGETVGCVWAYTQMNPREVIFGFYCTGGLDEPAIRIFLNALDVQ